jgi:hypothetical protein
MDISAAAGHSSPSRGTTTWEARRRHLRCEATFGDLSSVGSQGAPPPSPFNGRMCLMEQWNGNEPIATWIEREIRSALANGVQRPPRVAHELQIALPKTRAYYDELNRRPATATAVKRLFKKWSVRGAEQLARSLHLPPEGLKDLVWSHDLWERRLLRSPKLTPGARPFPAMPGNVQLAVACGYRVRPPRSSAADLALGAHRLAARVVDGKSWYAIAGGENGRKYPRETRPIRSQVSIFARELRIALPKNQAGRPREQLRNN